MIIKTKAFSAEYPEGRYIYIEIEDDVELEEEVMEIVLLEQE